MSDALGLASGLFFLVGHFSEHIFRYFFFCLHMHYMAAFDWSMEDGRRLIDDAAGRSIR